MSYGLVFDFVLYVYETKLCSPWLENAIEFLDSNIIGLYFLDRP